MLREINLQELGPTILLRIEHYFTAKSSRHGFDAGLVQHSNETDRAKVRCRQVGALWRNGRHLHRHVHCHVLHVV